MMKVLIAIGFTVFLAFFSGQVAAYPYGGKCQSASKKILATIAAKVFTGSPVSIKTNPDQKMCKHNIQVLTESGKPYLKITTRKGDGIGNVGKAKGWSDIRQGDRRRFELHLKRMIRDNQAFMFEYSVRIPKDNMFMEGPKRNVMNEAQFYIFQLKSPSVGSPVLSIKVSQSQGITALGFVAQKPADFGKWVKIRIEFRPAKSKKGFTRLWVDDEQLMNESGYQTIWSGESKQRHNIKFGIYQVHLDPNKIKADTQQSVEFKDIKHSLISK